MDLICSIDQCNRKHQARGFCMKHYNIWYNQNKDKNVDYIPRSNKGRYKVPDRVETKNGYITIRIDGKHVFEHRILMEQKLGRKLEKHESVHHINGIRNDNRLENLELWIGAIRYGQRATDIKCHNCGTPYKI